MKTIIALTLAGCITAVAGCSQSEVATGPERADGASAGQYLAASEPAGAVPVGQARQTVSDGDAVTLVGLIGGSPEPFVNGLAAFTIVDPKVPYCAEDEGCPTPWDYCCQTDQVKENIATVKVVDDTGKPVAADARSLLDVKELSTVVVHGQAQRDDQGNLAVLAESVFVRPTN